MAFQGAMMISDKDNVATCFEEVEAGANVEVRLGEEFRSIRASEKIPFGFKIAVTDIAVGVHILKYGESIGLASSPIRKGDLVHVHNLEGGKGRGDLAKGGSKGSFSDTSVRTVPSVSATMYWCFRQPTAP